MIQEHPRAAESHNCTDSLPHIGTVAVHRAFVALGLGIAELAAIKTGQGVSEQIAALSAQATVAFAPLTAPVVLPAPQFNHMADCFLLPIYTFHT